MPASANYVGLILFCMLVNIHTDKQTDTYQTYIHYIDKNKFTNICKHLHLHMSIHIHTYVCMCACIHLNIHTIYRAYGYIFMYTHMHIHTCTGGLKKV